MNSPADAQGSDADRVRVLTDPHRSAPAEDHEFAAIQDFLAADEIVKLRVKRDAPYEYSGVIGTFVVDPSAGGVDAFLDDLSERVGGGIFSAQHLSNAKTGGFGKKMTFKIAGESWHPITRRPPPAPSRALDLQNPVYGQQGPWRPPQDRRENPPELYELVKELINKHTSGGLSKEDLASALQTAMQHHAPQPVKQGLGEVAESIRQFKQLKELFAGDEPAEPVRGGDGAPVWLQGVIACAPYIPTVLGGLRSLLVPQAPPWAQQYAPPSGQPAPQMSGVPGWQAPASPAAPRTNPAEGPQNPQGQSTPPPAAEGAKVPEGYSEPDEQDSAEEEEEPEGDLLTPEEIVSEFKHATKEEQIKILAGQLACIDPAINEDLVRSMISQREAEPDPTATAAVKG